MSLGSEFFKGAPGGRGRPGNAGFKGVKGAVHAKEDCLHHDELCVDNTETPFNLP